MPKGTCKFIHQVSSDVAKDYVRFGADLLFRLGFLIRKMHLVRASGLEGCCHLPCLSLCHWYYLCSGPHRFSLLYMLRSQHLLELGRRNRGKTYATCVVSLRQCISPRCVGTGILRMESADHVCYSKITQVSQVEELCVQRPYLIPFLYLPCPLAAVMSCEVPQPEPLTHLHFGAQEGGRGESVVATGGVTIAAEILQVCKGSFHGSSIRPDKATLLDSFSIVEALSV